MGEKVTVDYWVIKDILQQNTTTIRVKLNDLTTYTWISIHHVLISDEKGNNNSMSYTNIQDSAEALFSLAKQYENFHTKDFKFKKEVDGWYKIKS